ncbi:hypothetical protein BDA99DRAFT_478432 [Phascolomyces articulosus]|uniref:Thiol-specific monooxygenase n=1 Tax=Phascolomyces articulosus TaxID=60185 RepID=A0AAD5K5K9_9FUNG|nr:hypothetical protein BDA99DRAFT_478432 [Phascolomyces articulosus]
MTLSQISISRIAVIGAGPSGIASARALRDEGAFDTITVFERNSEVGGTWIYSKEAERAPQIPSANALVIDPPCQPALRQPPFSAIYDNLSTNIPTTIMCYRDIPFPSNCPLFPDRHQVLAYVQSVAERYDLLPMIRFNTTVVCVEPTADNKWQISATEWLDDKETSYTELYDAIVVASGHHFIPFIPDIEGLKEFSSTATVLHAQNYRCPQGYANKTVLVVGKGPSSSDLVREISTTAAKVYYCIRGEETHHTKSVFERENPPKNVERVGPLSRFSADTGIIQCQDGKEIYYVDTVFFATGYLYSFPFLPFERDNLIVDGKTVFGIYEDIFYVKNPTLAFVGLHSHVVPMPFTQVQSMVIASYWSGRIALPPTKVMQEAIADETDNPKKLALGIEKEVAAVKRMGAWIEGYQGKLEDWNSIDPVIGPLSENWIKDRHRTLELRKKCLGY